MAGSSHTAFIKKTDLPFLTGLNSLTWLRYQKIRGLTKHHDVKVCRLNKKPESKLKHYYLCIDLGNTQTELNIICETHEFILENEAKLLTEFKELDE